MMSSLRTAVVAPFVVGAVLLVASVVVSDDVSAMQNSAVQSGIDYEAIKIAYRQRVARIEELKAEIYLCLSSIEWNEELWNLIATEELPHRAFAMAKHRFGEVFESAFEGHDNLVVKDRLGRLRLTREAMSAWAYVQAEQVLS